MYMIATVVGLLARQLCWQSAGMRCSSTDPEDPEVKIITDSTVQFFSHWDSNCFGSVRWGSPNLSWCSNVQRFRIFPKSFRNLNLKHVSFLEMTWLTVNDSSVFEKVISLRVTCFGDIRTRTNIFLRIWIAILRNRGTPSYDICIKVFIL